MIWTRYNISLPINEAVAADIKKCAPKTPIWGRVCASLVCPKWPEGTDSFPTYHDVCYGSKCGCECAFHRAYGKPNFGRPVNSVTYKKGKPYYTMPRRALMEALTMTCLACCPYDHYFFKRTITLPNGAVRQCTTDGRHFLEVYCSKCLVKVFADKYFRAFKPVSELHNDVPLVTVSDRFFNGVASIMTNFYYSATGTSCMKNGAQVRDI